MLLFLEQLHPMSSVKSKSAFGSERPLAHMAPARRAGAVSVLSGLPGACGSAKSIWEAKTLACPHRSKSNLPFSENSKWLLQHDCKIKINKANNVANCKKNMYLPSCRGSKQHMYICISPCRSSKSWSSGSPYHLQRSCNWTQLAPSTQFPSLPADAHRLTERLAKIWCWETVGGVRVCLGKGGRRVEWVFPFPETLLKYV